MSAPAARRSGMAPALLLGPALAAFMLFVALPLVGMLWASLEPPPGEGAAPSLANYRAFLADRFNLNVLVNTVSTSALATAVALLLGYPLALYMAFGTDRARRYLVLAVLSPLLVSVVVRSYALVILLGPNNPIDRVLPNGWTLDLLYTQAGVIVGLVYTLAPFLVLSVVSGLSTVDRRVLAAAYSLGAGSLTTIWRIVVPLSMPGVLSGCLIVFSLSFTSFALPLLLGGSAYKMLVLLIYQQMLVLFNWPFGYAMSTVMLILSGLLLFLATRFIRRAPEVLLQ